jgi:hypothetical protein
MAIKSRWMRWAGHVAHTREMRNAYKILVGKSEGKNHSEDLGIDGRTGLELIREIGWEVVDWIHLFQVKER